MCVRVLVYESIYSFSLYIYFKDKKKEKVKEEVYSKKKRRKTINDHDTRHVITSAQTGSHGRTPIRTDGRMPACSHTNANNPKKNLNQL